MNPSEIKRRMDKKLLPARMIWIGMMFSVAIYLGLGYLLPTLGVLPETGVDLPAITSTVLMAVGIIWAVAGVLIAGGKPPILKITEGDNPDAVMGKVFTGMVISWALCGSAGVMGLAIFFIFRSFQDLLILCIVAILGLLFAFPSEGKFKSALQTAGSGTPGMPM